MNSQKYPIFRDYLAVEIFGTGQYSNVYLVFTKRNKIKQFALKVFTQPRSTQNQMKINSEVALLRKLTHRNIVKFVEYIEDHKICYIVLQYCDGDTLRGLITIMRNKLDESVTRLLTQKLVRGLDYLHSLSICHMEHEICPNSYRKAKELIKKAINFDKSYEHSKSVPLYKEALLFLAAFVSVENDMNIRSSLDMKIWEYERWIKILGKDLSKRNEIAVQPLPNIKGAWYQMD